MSKFAKFNKLLEPVALLSLLLIMNAANADISFRELNKTAYNLEITGEIKPSDASMLIKHYDMVLAESKKPPAYIVHFNPNNPLAKMPL